MSSSLFNKHILDVKKIGIPILKYPSFFVSYIIETLLHPSNVKYLSVNYMLMGIKFGIEFTLKEKLPLRKSTPP